MVIDPEDYARGWIERIIQIKGLKDFNPIEEALRLNHGLFADFLFGTWRKWKEIELKRKLSEE